MTVLNPDARLVSGDTGPTLTLIFTRDGVPEDLTGATVVANIVRPGLTTLQKTLIVVNPPTNGQAQLFWAAGDLQATKPVDYVVDCVITAADGTTEIQPETIFFNVRPPAA